MSFIRVFPAAMSLAFSLSAIAGPSIELSDAWVRALPPTQPNTAAYLTIGNSGTESVEIVSASTAIADRVEFHTTREVDGFVRMEQLTTLKVAAGESLALVPAGIHLMLLGLPAMPQPGDNVKICLATSTGHEVCTDAPVRKDAGAVDHRHHHH